jgi:hypothetical protein
MKTLADILLHPYLHQQRKHDLGDDYTQREVNSWDNMRLVEAISDALEERLTPQVPEAPSKDKSVMTPVMWAVRTEALADVMAMLGAHATPEELADWLKDEHAASKANKTREEWENEI